MRTDNWELDQIANNSGGGGREVMEETLNNSFREQKQEVDQELSERESQRAAERENEENEVSLASVVQDLLLVGEPLPDVSPTFTQ